MQQWLSLLKDIRDHGVWREDRTGVGTWGLFGTTLTVNLQRRFPAVTTKKLAFKAAVGEMATFISGSHCLAAFHQNNCRFWDHNGMDPEWRVKAACQYPGDLGRIYGAQWRFWRGVSHDGKMKIVDQLAELVRGLQENPYSRRHMVTAWNPAELDQMCLPPCPMFFQCYVVKDLDGSCRHLDMLVYQRSCDTFLGLPCDLAGYALLQHLIAKECGLKARKLIFSIGDAHIYSNHLEAVETVLTRAPSKAPVLELKPDARLFGFEPDMVELTNYFPHPAVHATLN